MCSVSFRIISSGASNSIVCSIICFCFCFLFFVFCSRLALVLYVVCRCCNKVSFKKKKKKKNLSECHFYVQKIFWLFI